MHTVTFMQVRGVQLEGGKLVELINHVSRFLGQEAGRKMIKGHDQQGTRRKLWTSIGGITLEPTGLPA